MMSTRQSSSSSLLSSSSLNSSGQSSLISSLTHPITSIKQQQSISRLSVPVTRYSQTVVPHTHPDYNGLFGVESIAELKKQERDKKKLKEFSKSNTQHRHDGDGTVTSDKHTVAPSTHGIRSTHTIVDDIDDFENRILEYNRANRNGGYVLSGQMYLR